MKRIKKTALGILFSITLITGIGIKTQFAAAAENTAEIVAKVDNYVLAANAQIESTDLYNLSSYAAQVSPVSQFVGPDGLLNVIYDGVDTITLVSFDANMKPSSVLITDKVLPLFGGAICDSFGNYYVVYGQNDEASTGNAEVLRVVKYDSNLNKIGEVGYLGSQTCPYSGLSWGTRYPFHAGNCSIDMNGDILVCSYAREMYSGHQSNHVIYVNTGSMTKLNLAPTYTSHSFDQRVMVTADGNYLFADQGDFYSRGFCINEVLNSNTDIWDNKSFVSFHFREGSNRSYGYNETYAQLAGIGEVSTGYVLTGASEETLSYATNPTNREYCGDSEARNLFVQIFHKDFWNYSDEGKQLLNTSVRQGTGSKPSSAQTKLSLNGDEKDYGVLWLTDYTDQYAVVNPQLVVTDQDKMVLLWEKFKYGDENKHETYVDSYYMVLNADGTVYQEATALHGIRLTSYEEPVFINGCVHWTTIAQDSEDIIVHQLHLGETVTLTEIGSLSINSISQQKFTGDEVTPSITISNRETQLTEGIDYSVEYDNNILPGKATVIITGKGSYTGIKKICFNIGSVKINFTRLFSDVKGKIDFSTKNDVWYDYDGIEVAYSLNKDFTMKKTKIFSKSYGSIKGLTSKKTYYIKVRSYVLVDGKRVYGSYCKVTTIKVG